MTAQPNEVISLWPDGPPTKLEGVGPEVEYRAPVGSAAEAVMLRNVSEPTLTVLRPAKPNGIGVIVCPGGGWRIRAWEHEGLDVARWLTAHGYTASLLKYRVRGTPAAQADFDAEMVLANSGIDLTRWERMRSAPSARSSRPRRFAMRGRLRRTMDAARSRSFASGRTPPNWAVHSTAGVVHGMSATG